VGREGGKERKEKRGREGGREREERRGRENRINLGPPNVWGKFTPMSTPRTAPLVRVGDACGWAGGAAAAKIGGRSKKRSSKI
jgi:hypothetical protein